tara:strand:+ start:117 stop:497 length:381 start_codon:yes stop_codon:yes gene_type:complete
MKLDYLKYYNTEELKSEEAESLIELEKTKKSLELKLAKLDRIKKLLIERGAETNQKTESNLPLHGVMLCYVDTYSANGYPTFKKGKFYPIEKSYLKGLLIMRNEQGIITKMSGEYWETIKDNFNKA